MKILNNFISLQEGRVGRKGTRLLIALISSCSLTAKSKLHLIILVIIVSLTSLQRSISINRSGMFDGVTRKTRAARAEMKHVRKLCASGVAARCEFRHAAHLSLLYR